MNDASAGLAIIPSALAALLGRRSVSPRRLGLRGRAREHALRPPALLGFIAAPRRNARIPTREQWLGAGAALGNLLNAAHALGYGAIVLSGERCFDEELLQRLGVHPDEALVGFISIGSIREAPPAVVGQSTDIVRSFWQPRGSPSSDVDAARLPTGANSSPQPWCADALCAARGPARQLAGPLIDVESGAGT